MKPLRVCSAATPDPMKPQAQWDRKSPRMTVLLEKLRHQMKEMCSEGEEVTRCMNKLHTALQQYIDLHKASDSMQGGDVNASDTDLTEDLGGLQSTSTPSSGRHPSSPADLSPLRVEDWIPNVLQYTQQHSDIDDTYLDCSHNTLDALYLCNDGIASQVMVYNKSNCCIVDAGSVTVPVNVNVNAASPVTVCIRASSPITVSSGYDSDNVMPTREDEIDLLLHGADQHQHSHSQRGKQNIHCNPRPFKTGQRSASDVQDLRHQAPKNIPRTRSCLAFGQDTNAEQLLNLPTESSSKNFHPCPRRPAMPKTTYCLKRTPTTNVPCQSGSRSRLHRPTPNDATVTSCEYAASDNSSEYSLIDTYLEPLPSVEVTRHEDSSVHYWSDPTRSDLGYDDSLSSISDTSSLECSVRWNSGVSASVDSGRGSWCSQDSFRIHRDALDDGRVTPLSEENVYETIPDDIPDESPTNFSRSDCTYDKIDSSLLMDLPAQEPPKLPARNYRHSTTSRRPSKLCPPNDVHPLPKGARDSAAHIDDIVKHSDIVDMSSYHVYTVKDVLDSVDRFAGHLVDQSGRKSSSKGTSQNGNINKSTSLKDIRDVGRTSNSLSRSMSNTSCRSKKSSIEYFKCRDTPKPTSVIERFQMRADHENYMAQWHVNVTGKPATYC